MSKLSLPPDGAILRAHAHANHRWWLVLAEWIDNALDAGARTVSFEFTKDSLRLTDDGDGCADPTDMIRLGAHKHQRTTKLGRFGIGGKESALWVGGLNSMIDIRTVHQGCCRMLTVDWSDYAENWEIDEPTERPAEQHEAGTVIVITPAVKRPPAGQDWKDLMSELGYLYSPAIKHGRQIKFKRPTKSAEWEPLLRWEAPKFDGKIVDERIIVHGRGARVYCGVVEGPNPRNGFTYVHEWRVIQKASALGCGQYSPAHMWGFVDLDASWALTKNKDGVSSYAEELYAEVERVALPVLKRADKVGTELQSDRFMAELNQQFGALLSTKRAKAKRVPGETHGTKTPTGEGGPHKQAEKEQTGQRFIARQGSKTGLKISTYNAGTPDVTGTVKPPHITLNRDNPYIDRVWREGNVDAVVSIAVALVITANNYAPDERPLLKGLERGITPEEFSKAMGAVLSHDLSIDGKVLSVA